MDLLSCGPLIRYVDKTTAVIWVELTEPLEVEVILQPQGYIGTAQQQRARAWPVQIQDFYYAWVPCRFLIPETWYSYSIIGLTKDGRQHKLWPISRLTTTPYQSIFRTLPTTSINSVRIVFGSCRGGYPKNDRRAQEEGIDILEVFANEMAAHWENRDQRWPHMFIFTGDQIYSDELSERLTRKFRRSYTRLYPPPAKPVATKFSEFAEVYRDSWTLTPIVRWILSCIPSFMIFDDHDVIDDWNISSDWVSSRHRSPDWVRLLTAGLMTYWIFQGAGNLNPTQWNRDERMRWLVPRYSYTQLDLFNRLERLFRDYVLRHRRATWGLSVDLPSTRVVFGDTRMSRKLTGKRLIMNTDAWREFVDAAKESKARSIILVAPGPVLCPHTLHDLLSRVAESIEEDPPSVIGGVVGGLVGGLIAGPVGIAIGAVAGSVGGEILIDKYLPELLEFADAELWPAFPKSFNRMITLLEDLSDGRGTNRKRFVGIIAGDVHHSHIIRGDLLQSRRRASIWHFTMSPIQREVGEKGRELLSGLDGGKWYYDAALAVERPDFVEDQLQRLNWYPISLKDGRRAREENLEDWDFFGKFLGELIFEPGTVSYRYYRACTCARARGYACPNGSNGKRLEVMGEQRLFLV